MSPRSLNRSSLVRKSKRLIKLQPLCFAMVTIKFSCLLGNGGGWSLHTYQLRNWNFFVAISVTAMTKNPGVHAVRDVAFTTHI